MNYRFKTGERGGELERFGWGAAYVLAAIAFDTVSTIGLYRDIGVTPWSPSVGLALAFANIAGRRSWPYIFCAHVVSSLWVTVQPLGPLAVVLLAVGGSAVWVTAGRALHWLPNFDPMLRTLHSALLLFGVAVAAALADAMASIGLLWMLGLIDTATLLPASWRYMVGDVVGVLVVTPLVLLVRGGWQWPRPQPVHLLQLLVLVLGLIIIFQYRAATTYQLFYLLFLPVLWVALRDGVGGATLVLNACQLGIIIGAQLRFGVTPGTAALQMMMIVLTITGLLVGVVVTEREANARWLRNQQSALNRQLRLRSAGETAAAIAHQINQPLTAISTYASIAADALDAGKPEAATEPINKLVAECDRAAAVLKSIRDLVKQGALTREMVRLQSVVSDLIQLHSEESKTNRIALVTDIPANLPRLDCDSVQLEQALENLINNSIEAISETGKPGTITISGRQEAGIAVIEVTDDGPGFAPGLDQIATTPFMTTKANGSGLGLAIARSVAEAHGGSLAVVARSSGATVRLTLPPRRRNDL